MEIVVEANVTERKPHRPVITIPFEFPFRDSVVSTQVKDYDIHEMLGTKLRALFQRWRGRDLFDLYWARTIRPGRHLYSAKNSDGFQETREQVGSYAGFSRVKFCWHSPSPLS
jgi:hypothetical protein